MCANLYSSLALHRQTIRLLRKRNTWRKRSRRWIPPEREQEDKEEKFFGYKRRMKKRITFQKRSMARRRKRG